MNIVIEHSEISSFLVSISKVLSSIGHRVIFWDQNKKSVYEMISELNPDLIVVTDKLKQNYWKLLEDKKYILYGINDPLNKAIAKINYTNLIDLFSYPNTFENYIFNTDILFSTNYYDEQKDFTRIMDKIFEKTNLKIKCCGHRYMQSPYFIGLLETEDFTKIAKCSKIVITTDEIEKSSLLNRKIYSILPNELTIEQIENICENPKLLNKFLKEARKELTTKNSIEFVSNILDIIGLNEDKNKTLSMLGNLL